MSRRRVPPPPCPYEVPFVPSPAPVVQRMVRLAQVGPKDVVFDLGCGDGRLLWEAAKCGARAVGIEIDPQRVRALRQRIRDEKLTGRVSVRRADLFDVHLQRATVIVFFLLPHVLKRLAPRLAGLKPGTKIVSHAFPLPGWEPSRVVEVRRKNRFDRKLYLYEVR